MLQLHYSTGCSTLPTLQLFGRLELKLCNLVELGPETWKWVEFEIRIAQLEFQTRQIYMYVPWCVCMEGGFYTHNRIGPMSIWVGSCRLIGSLKRRNKNVGPLWPTDCLFFSVCRLVTWWDLLAFCSGELSRLERLELSLDSLRNTMHIFEGRTWQYSIPAVDTTIPSVLHPSNDSR